MFIKRLCRSLAFIPACSVLLVFTAGCGADSDVAAAAKAEGLAAETADPTRRP